MFFRKRTATRAEEFLKQLEQEAITKAVTYGTRFESLDIASVAKGLTSEQLVEVLLIAPDRANELIDAWRKGGQSYNDPRASGHRAIELFASWAMRTTRVCTPQDIEALCEVAVSRKREYCPTRS